MRPYRLAPSVHLRMSEAGAILLNVYRDEFFGLDAQQTRGLSALLTQAIGASNADNALETLAQTLCSSGLIELTDTGDGDQSPHYGLSSNSAAASVRKEPVVTCPIETLPEVRCELIPWERMGVPCVRPHHVLAFIRAWSLGAYFVGRGRLARAVERARLRRANVAAESFHLPTARRLLRVFYHIRAFAYGKRAQCLMDSLVLLEFLATYRIHPTWVIGVQVRPFASHSWLQYRHYVLNGTAVYVRRYLPILTV